MSNGTAGEREVGIPRGNRSHGDTRCRLGRRTATIVEMSRKRRTRHVTMTLRPGEHAGPAARSTRTKAMLLLSMVGMTLLVAACGRASDAEIMSAIGITPTPT